MSPQEQIKNIKFRPALFAFNRHLQTIFGSFGKRHIIDSPSQVHHILLPDGDKLVCEESIPHQWKHNHPTVILVHGIGGSHDSRYMIRMAKHLLHEGHRVIRVCLRGCGDSSYLCQRPYHGGQSDDLLNVIHHFRIPESPTVLVGYSLGGNITLKLAGELDASNESLLNGVIAVCPPFDLNKTVNKIVKMPFRFYERYFMVRLRAQYKTWAKHHSYLKPEKLPRGLNLEGFDDFHTAPKWNFKSAREYYTVCSSANFIPDIKIPCDIICTLDDPVVDTDTINHLPLPKQLQVWKMSNGGHMGFLGNPVHQNGIRWMEQFLVDLIKKQIKVT